MGLVKPHNADHPGATSRRVCVLTGASGHLGAAFCARYRRRYDIVAVCGSRLPAAPDQHSRYVDPLKPDASSSAAAPPVFTIQTDLTADREITRVVEVALARFGRVDLLVNAAVHSVWAPIVESEALLASMRHQFETNVAVPLQLSAEIAAAFWRDRREENLAANRNIVNVSSIAGVHVYPEQGQSVYAASKAALNMLTRHMAIEFAAFGVRVNAVAPDSFPGRIATECVTDCITAFDDGDENGDIAVLQQEAVPNPSQQRDRS
jgi:NAD(P)-dependent dehydrogenase (short-subunit alcohol dehydrogenase family)